MFLHTSGKKTDLSRKLKSVYASYLSRINGIERKAVMIACESVPCENVYRARLGQTVDLLEKAHGGFRRFIVYSRYADVGKDVVNRVDP